MPEQLHRISRLYRKSTSKPYISEYNIPTLPIRLIQHRHPGYPGVHTHRISEPDIHHTSKHDTKEADNSAYDSDDNGRAPGNEYSNNYQSAEREREDNYSNEPTFYPRRFQYLPSSSAHNTGDYTQSSYNTRRRYRNARTQWEHDYQGPDLSDLETCKCLN